MRSWDARRGGEGGDGETDWGSAYYSNEYYDQEYYEQQYYGGGYRDAASGAAPRRAGLFVRAGRVVSGAVCGAVVVLTIVVCAAQYLAGGRDFPGPGGEAVVAHLVAAVVASVAQVVADRRRGMASLLAACVVIFTASILMFTQWWG